jgi:hypothetical protein
MNHFDSYSHPGQDISRPDLKLIPLLAADSNFTVEPIIFIVKSMPENSITPSLRCGLLNSNFRRAVAIAALSGLTALNSNAQSASTNKPTIVPAEMFAAPEGLEVTVWATTPLLYNPTNIEVDMDGRVWVAEGVDYRSHSKRRPEGDRIVVLEDTHGSGKADKEI